MTETILHAESDRATGSSASRRLRRDDRIPAVVYGLGMEPLSVSVARPDLRAAVSGAAGMNTILDLTVAGSVYPALIKDVQRHPVRQNITHIDFIQVDLNAKITVSVPVRLEGEAKEVASGNGLVDLRDLQSAFDADAHPDVREGRRQAYDIRGEVLSALRDAAGRSFALNRSELILVYIMLIIVAALCTMGMTQQLLPLMTGLFYYASPQNKWAEKLLPHVPQRAMVNDGDNNRLFYEGLESADQAIPYGAWVYDHLHAL